LRIVASHPSLKRNRVEIGFAFEEFGHLRSGDFGSLFSELASASRTSQVSELALASLGHSFMRGGSEMPVGDEKKAMDGATGS
jgi:hypothetical protein